MIDTAHQLVNGLIKSGAGGIDHSTEVIETHISIVLLTSEFAYKLKKPVNFGFVDFRALERRKFYCEEEVRLNKRLAEDLYIGVVPIKGSLAKPVFGGDGDAIDYLVKMHRFENDAELGSVVQQQIPVARQFKKFARELAQFHLGTAIADPHCHLGQPVSILVNVKDNFRAVEKANLETTVVDRISRIKCWSELRAAELFPVMEERKAQGFIRECHGDLHLRNLVLLKNRIVAFDCLEFSPELRWIDVASELAFLLMDLTKFKLDAVAAEVLNRYLECTCDYQSLMILRFYLVYRAMVRAKVAFLTVGKEASKTQSGFAVEPYLSVAEEIIEQSKRTPSLIVTYGLSGSGKSWVSKKLCLNPGVIHIRSDVIRDAVMKDLCNTEEKYSLDSRDRVYTEMEKIAETILSAGYSVIVDATFLRQQARTVFRELADKYGVTYHILHMNFPQSVLEARINKRRLEKNDPSEADIAVLHQQIDHNERLTDEEVALSIGINEHSRLDDTGLTELARELNLV